MRRQGKFKRFIAGVGNDKKDVILTLAIALIFSHQILER